MNYNTNINLNIRTKVEPCHGKGVFGACVHSKGPDQTVHGHSLIWVFAVHSQNYYILSASRIYSVYRKRLLLDCVAQMAQLDLYCLYNPGTPSLMAWLGYNYVHIIINLTIDRILPVA